MKRRTRYIYAVLLMGLQLGGLAGCTPKSEHFQERPATFWDGICHGMIAWIYSFFGGLPEPARSTPEYDQGVSLGTIWTLLWSLPGILIGTEVAADGKVDGCLSVPIGLLTSCLGGILIGACIYWPIYGLAALIIYLLGAVGAWFNWLVGAR